MSDDDSDGGETQSRAERLTDRRSRSRERTYAASAKGESTTDTSATQTGQTDQTGHSEQADQTPQTEGAEGETEAPEWSQAGEENVKRENTALYMYLDQRLHDAVIDVFEDVKYHYRKAYDVELQKNRHVYPLILEHGLEPVREMADSPADIRAALDANPHTGIVGSASETDA